MHFLTIVRSEYNSEADVHLPNREDVLSNVCTKSCWNRHSQREHIKNANHRTMAKRGFKKSEGTNLIAVIGDEDTVTGFLLTGIGERNNKGETNYLIVDSKTPSKTIEDAFKRFLRTPNISVILVNQDVAEKDLRPLINEYEGIVPTILEIPSKENAYDPKKDTIMQKAYKMLYGSDFTE